MDRFSRLLGGAAITLTLGLFTGAIAWAQGEIPPQPGLGLRLMQMLPMMMLIFFIFYLMVFRPQSIQARQHVVLLESLKKGMSVVTSGGLIGKVSAVEKDHVLLEVANGVRIKFEKEHIKRKAE